MERDLRKNQSTLRISGLAIIAFEAWNVVQMILLMVTQPDEVGLNELDLSVRIIYYIVLAVICAVMMGLRLIVGLSARAEANGKKKGFFYLVVAVVVAIMSISNVVIIIQSAADESLVAIIFSLIIELTSLFAIVELFVSSIRVKRYTRQLENKEAVENAA